MKTLLKVVGGILLALVIVVAGFVGYVKSQMAKPDAPRIDAGNGVVGVQSSFSYAWIVKTPHGAVLVDAGNDSTGHSLLSELSAEGVAPADVKAILLTHGHTDHWGGASLFPNATVFVGPGDAALVRGEKHVMPVFIENRMPKGVVPHTLIELKGGEHLDFDGAGFDVISIPGHTDGSVAYLHGRLLFTGDSLMKHGPDAVSMGPTMFSQNSTQNKESLHKLLTVPFDDAADGHAGLTHDAKKKLQRFLE